MKRINTKQFGLVRLSFRHDTVMKRNKERPSCLCSIDRIDEEGKVVENIVAARSVCGKGDSPHKETGRRVALKKAVDQLEADRQLRKEILGAYYNRERRGHGLRELNSALKQLGIKGDARDQILEMAAGKKKGGVQLAAK